MSGLFDASLPQSLYPTLPHVFTVTLRNKTSAGGNTAAGNVADGYGSALPVSARRRPCTQDELVRANLLGADKTISFSILKTGTEAAWEDPQPEARITDHLGVNWTVKTVKDTVMSTLFACVCVQGW